jgi:hypothetical protein
MNIHWTDFYNVFGKSQYTPDFKLYFQPWTKSGTGQKAGLGFLEKWEIAVGGGRW